MRSGKRGDRETVRSELGIAPGETAITVLANLIPYKGHAEVVAAVPRVLATHPEARFVFVGRGRRNRAGACAPGA